MKTILSETLWFAGCVAKVITAQPSGTNSSDVIYLATELYNKRCIESISEGCGPTFKLFSCWSELKDHSKFDIILNPPENATVIKNIDKNRDVPTPIEEVESFKRPVGRKNAKLEDAKTELAAKTVQIAE